MSKRTRILVAAGIGFVGYRIAVEFMQLASALLVGLVLLGCAYALIGLLRTPTDRG